MKSLELFIFIFGICIAYFSYANNINEGEHTRYIEVREITNLCGVNCVYIVQKIYNIGLKYSDIYRALMPTYTSKVSIADIERVLNEHKIKNHTLKLRPSQLYDNPYCLFIMYLIAIPLWQVKRNLVILGITIFSVLLNIGFEIHDVTLPEVFQIANTIAYIPYFLIGYSIKHLNTGEVHNQTRILTLVLSILVSFALDYLKYTINVDSFYLFSLVHTLARITALYLIVDGLFANRKIRVLDLLSKYSLQLMFFDSFYKVILFMLAEAIGLSTASLQIAIILAFLNIVLGTISCCIAKRIPVLRTAIGI